MRLSFSQKRASIITIRIYSQQKRQNDKAPWKTVGINPKVVYTSSILLIVFSHLPSKQSFSIPSRLKKNVCVKVPALPRQRFNQPYRDKAEPAKKSRPLISEANRGLTGSGASQTPHCMEFTPKGYTGPIVLLQKGVSNRLCCIRRWRMQVAVRWGRFVAAAAGRRTRLGGS